MRSRSATLHPAALDALLTESLDNCRRVMTAELQEQAESSGRAAACSSGAVARADAARAADAVQVSTCSSASSATLLLLLVQHRAPALVQQQHTHNQPQTALGTSLECVQVLEEALPATADDFMDLIRQHALQPGADCQAAGHLLHIAATCLVRPAQPRAEWVLGPCPTARLLQDWTDASGRQAGSALVSELLASE